ncbi:Cytochrome c [Pirellulimonas nuda]|uniref:Cytochrome c n=1 Tax=Pirellulimonas nuda TaxID=2528009 RepID=A0A518D6U5_9BACT|nr:c-type cytochrome [Pirellulimonas nuda]QDU87203.1 Cytochrome c [Pirellulimonas nuda]
MPCPGARTAAAIVAALLCVGGAGGQAPGAGAPAELPPGKLGEAIALGRAIVENTKDHPLSKPFVGNALNCTSCHLDNGTHPEAATFLGVAAAYPAWSPREARVITLEQRVQNCFIRSENGARPPLGGEVATAITAYITWLSTGQPIQQNADRPLGPRAMRALEVEGGDAERGAALYADHCVSCHGDQGEGDDVSPPLWGDQSYNDGAGMSQAPKLASYLKVAMPLDDPILSEQEATDIAAYVNGHARPRFRLSDHAEPAP